MYSAASARDESVVVAGGEDGVLRIWNGANGQVFAQTRQGHDMRGNSRIHHLKQPTDQAQVVIRWQPRHTPLIVVVLDMEQLVDHAEIGDQVSMSQTNTFRMTGRS